MLTLYFFLVVVLWCRAYAWWSPSLQNRYLLWDHSTKEFIEMSSNGDVPKDVWKSTGDTKLLMHGYNPFILKPAVQVLEEHYMLILAREYAAYDKNLNIIVVDWTKLSTAALPNYPVACDQIKPAARDVADFLVNLEKAKAIPDLSTVHILGLSLGAQMAGASGYEVINLSGGQKIGRITGFDPAGPLFSTITGKWPSDMSYILDYNDATFVDVIHTNVGWEPVFTGSLGTNLESGHVDFYPNGGIVQRSQCSALDDRTAYCSHQMSVLFYALALRRPNDFIGCPCDNYEGFTAGSCSCSYPGEGAPLGDLTFKNLSKMQGRYYLTISEPLSKHDFKIQ